MIDFNDQPIENLRQDAKRIMGYCAILVLKNINPRHLRAMDIKLGEEDHYHFLAKKGKKWLIYQNVGRDLSDPEYDSLKKYVKTWGGGEQVDCKNGILHMEVPEFVWRFFEDINMIPGARVSANTFQHGGDAYLSVEFQEGNVERVSEKILEFVGEDGLFKKEIVYVGRQTGILPHILKLYSDFNNNLGDFSVFETLWEPTVEEREKQNMGVFLNQGLFVPKAFVDGERDKLIARLDSLEVKGDSSYKVIDEKNSIVEFDVKTKFFSDFYNEIIESYSGPLFLSLKVDERGISSYYILESDVQQLFIQGLYRHWKRPSRMRHKNYIMGVHTLDKWIMNRDLPF